jgi:hypothetical protein
MKKAERSGGEESLLWCCHIGSRCAARAIIAGPWRVGFSSSSRVGFNERERRSEEMR